MDSLDAIVPAWMQAIISIVAVIVIAAAASFRRMQNPTPAVASSRADFMAVFTDETRENRRVLETNRDLLQRIAISNEAILQTIRDQERYEDLEHRIVQNVSRLISPRA